MMRFLFIMFCLVVLNSTSLKACDACGCSAGYTGIGLMSKYKGNFVRFTYADFRYKTSAGHANSNSKDLFTQIGFSFRYAFKKAPKIRLNAHIPFGFNKRSQNEVIQHLHGFADTKFVVNYAILNNRLIDEEKLIFLEVGGGINISTGKYDPSIQEKNLPDNFNIGSGSYGYILQLNSLLSVGNSGFLLNANYQLNGDTSEDYHFGNQLVGEFSVFREWEFKEHSIIPNIGFAAEHVGDNHFANGNKVPETGGNGLFFDSGVNLKSTNLISGISYSIPLLQNYANGAVNAGTRISAHITYLF